MVVAVTSTGPSLNSEVDIDFGRTCYVLFVDLYSGDIEVMDNRDNMEADQESGIRVAKKVNDANAKWVLTGHVGPKAFQSLIDSGIRIGAGASGTVRDTLKRFKEGEFESTEEAVVMEGSKWS